VTFTLAVVSVCVHHQQENLSTFFGHVSKFMNQSKEQAEMTGTMN
jgi:hypothetical protein